MPRGIRQSTSDQSGVKAEVSDDAPARGATPPGPSATDLTSLFAAEADRVFGFLLARCGSRAIAEDLTAETFIAAQCRFAEGRGHEIGRGWLFTVARRRLVDHWRAESARSRRLGRLATEAQLANRRLGVPHGTDDLETGVEAALGSLSDRHRAVLVLRYLEDFSVSEVADALDLGYKATESLLTRARVAFSRAYEEAGHG